MTKITDTSFGEMEYKYGWVKTQKFMLWGAQHNLKIKAKAHKGAEITQAQRDSYENFTSNIMVVSKRSLELAAEYLKKHHTKSDYDTVKELITPKSVLFKRDGSYGILCDFALDEEHGLAICLFPTEEVGIQDIFI